MRMTDDEKQAAQLLVRCVFLPGSNNKRFAIAMSNAARFDNEITERQSRLLWTLFYTYRRQIIKPSGLTPEVARLLKVAYPVYRDERAGRGQRAGRDELKRLEAWLRAVKGER